MPRRSDLQLAIGQRVREARTSSDLTQADLARVLDIHRSAISLIESGGRVLSVAELSLLLPVFAPIKIPFFFPDLATPTSS